MRERPLRIDCLVREIPGRAALVANGHDGPEAAVQICKDLTDVLSSGEYRLTLITDMNATRDPGDFGPASPSSPTTTARQSFRGLPMTSKIGSRCAVCNDSIDVGASIIYSREQRRAAHRKCGESILGARR